MHPHIYLEFKEGVGKMQKVKIVSIGFLVILFVVASLYINHVSIQEKTIEPSMSSKIAAEIEEKPKDIKEISTRLYQRDGFFEQVGKKLEELGYDFQALVTVQSKDDIQVKYVLENKNATKSVQKEVESIFYESIEIYNLDSDSFDLKISDYDDGADFMLR